MNKYLCMKYCIYIFYLCLIHNKNATFIANIQLYDRNQFEMKLK